MYLLLYFRCYEYTDITLAGVTGAVLFVLVAVALMCSIYAFSKRRENQKLRDEIAELENEGNTNSNLIAQENDATRNQVTSEIPITSAEGLPITST